jgi:flagellar biosynthesis chaperone FliJ
MDELVLKSFLKVLLQQVHDQQREILRLRASLEAVRSVLQKDSRFEEQYEEFHEDLKTSLYYEEGERVLAAIQDLIAQLQGK